MNEQDTAAVSKGGLISIETNLKRDPAGIRLTVRALPQVEEFLRSWGNGDQQPIQNHGRKWAQVDQPLKVWALEKNPGTLYAEDGMPFQIHRPGQDLLAPDGDGRGEILNMSFLRLVGISEGGIRFTVREVWSPEEIRKVTARILLAQKRLYIAYLRPISITVQLSTQEVRG